MLAYPNINPVALQIGPLAIHWYGLLYLVAFAGAYFLIDRKKQLNRQQMDDLLFYVAVGVILGGRLGYVLFYGLPYLKADPLFLFKVWEGGMSFHGGLIGVCVGLMYFAHRYDKKLLWIGDLVAPAVPFGLAMGRLGNYINGELWGRVTTLPWGMVFPHAGALPRHPSSLYELALEGVLLFTVLNCYAKKPRKLGQISGLFLLGYALCRIIVELFREPDSQMGFFLGGYFTMGQLLSIPMILVGLYLIFRKTVQE